MENKKILYEEAKEAFAKGNPYMGIMFEKLHDSMELLLEGHEVMQSRIDRLDGRMAGVESRLDSLEVKVDSLEAGFDLLNRKADSLESKFDYLILDFHNKANKEDVIELGNRVGRLEMQQ